MSAIPNVPGPKLVTTKVRGTVIKVPDTTPGLLILNGNQRQFMLEGVWKSSVAPEPNMTVEVELDDADTITAIVAVDSAQLARERFNELSGKIGAKIGDLTKRPGNDGLKIAQEFLRKLAARMGVVALGATVLMWVALFFLPGYKFDLGFVGSQSYSLWEFIGLNLTLSGGIEISHGFWGLIGFLSILAPFVTPFIPDPRAKFANLLPLVYFITSIFAERSSLAKVLQVPGVPDAGLGASMQIGTYLVLGASLVLAAMVLKSSASARQS